jgi:quercetin dioxygenase-like cupin family protein
MPVVTAQEAPLFEAGATTIRGLTSPSRGARDVSTWRITCAAGEASPVHSLTREETFLVLAGSLTAHFPEHAETAHAGDALIIPAGELFHLIAENGPAEAICVLPVGGQARTEQGIFTPPWAE